MAEKRDEIKPWNRPPIDPRKQEMLNVLKNGHGRRVAIITESLRESKDPEKYLKEMEKEDGAYEAILEAVDVYFSKEMEP